jgi:uncharacterized protein (TIGR01777 family)
MKVLLTGGTGLVGTEITSQLLKKGHEVVYLSRNPNYTKEGVTTYGWDPDTGDYDLNALHEVDAIINLAGAPVNQKWTPAGKSAILKSRTDSLRLLFAMVRESGVQLKAMLSASGVGYYPTHLEKNFTETDKAGNNFLSEVCVAWENQASQFELLDVSPTIFRIGVVLSEKGGALDAMLTPTKLGIGSPLGSGKQWMPWIHIEDLAAMFIHAMENSVTGVYNAVGPNPLRNKDFMKTLAQTLNRPFFMPAVPAFVLKLIMGESSVIALEGQKADNVQILSTGFRFKHQTAKEALTDLLK